MGLGLREDGLGYGFSLGLRVQGLSVLGDFEEALGVEGCEVSSVGVRLLKP